MTTDELRAALEWADQATLIRDRYGDVACSDYMNRAARALLHLHRENAELRRVLGRYVAIGDSASLEDHMGQQPEASMLWDEMYHEAQGMLAGEVQDADVSPPVKFKPGSDVVHAHDCPCWTCEGYREDMAREVHDAAE